MAKFTIEQVIEKIKGMFTNGKGETTLLVSDRSIRETLEPFLSFIGDEVTLDQFVTTQGYQIVDSQNRNLIKVTSDIYKNNDVTPKTQQTQQNQQVQQNQQNQQVQQNQQNQQVQQTQQVQQNQQQAFDMNAFAQAINTAINTAISPLTDKITALETERNLSTRDTAVKDLIEKNFKLSQNWKVDMDNSVSMAKLKLGAAATAAQVYEEAKTLFNNTLTARGETYTPAASTETSGKVDFSAIIAQQKARHPQQK